jgi:hypothetical protein
LDQLAVVTLPYKDVALVYFLTLFEIDIIEGGIGKH